MSDCADIEWAAWQTSRAAARRAGTRKRRRAHTADLFEVA